MIGGTARSGSTLLSLMLGNDPKGLTIGEVINLMRPNGTNERLNDKNCFCSDPNCTFWRDISRAGEKHLYSKVFERRPDINFIVDASKSPLWLKDQLKYSKKKNYEIIPVLIFKSPLHYAYSKAKRGSLNRWKKGWSRRYQNYFYLLDDFQAIKYEKLASNPATELEKLCRAIDIPYFDGKEFFWKSDHSHALYGSTSVMKSNKLIYKQQYDQEKLNWLKNNLNISNDKLLANITKVLNAFENRSDDEISDAVYALKKELAYTPALSNFLIRVQSTPYFMINRPLFLLNKFLFGSVVKEIKSLLHSSKAGKKPHNSKQHSETLSPFHHSEQLADK
jgi:hypothetical protein